MLDLLRTMNDATFFYAANGDEPLVVYFDDVLIFSRYHLTIQTTFHCVCYI